MVYCTKCGKKNDEGAEYCIDCGLSLFSVKNERTQDDGERKKKKRVFWSSWR